jgi:hypothetical protein
MLNYCNIFFNIHYTTGSGGWKRNNHFVFNLFILYFKLDSEEIK